jgi:hypothetical protein
LGLFSRAEIAVLEREQEEILKNMRLIESRSNQNKDDKNCESLGDLGREKGKATGNQIQKP